MSVAGRTIAPSPAQWKYMAVTARMEPTACSLHASVSKWLLHARWHSSADAIKPSVSGSAVGHRIVGSFGSTDSRDSFFRRIHCSTSRRTRHTRPDRYYKAMV